VLGVKVRCWSEWIVIRVIGGGWGLERFEIRAKKEVTIKLETTQHNTETRQGKTIKYNTIYIQYIILQYNKRQNNTRKQKT
jgi:hypothetical protein